MALRELVEMWRGKADEIEDIANAQAVNLGENTPVKKLRSRAEERRACASELEAALAKEPGVWTRIEEIPEAWKDDRPLELWGPNMLGRAIAPDTARWHPRGGKVMYARINGENEAEWTVAMGFTHARLIDPPPDA